MTQRPAPSPVRTMNSAAPSSERALADVVDTHRAELKSIFPVPPARSPRAKRAAASTALALLLGGGLWWTDPAYRSEAFATRVGEISSVALADGSHVVLDTDTRLSVEWHLRSRRVALQQGRANFDVAHNVLRPLTVDAGPAQVRVVGTRFDVWRRADATLVSVYQGKVAVWRSAEAQERGVLLRPGEQTSVAASAGEHGEALRVRPLTNPDAQAWRLGRLVFNETPLDEVIAAVQRYRRPPVTLAAPSLARLKVSGVFEVANTDQLLDLLPGTLPVSLHRQPDGGIEIGPR